MARDHVYIYLCYGPSQQTPRELRYSVETLLPEIGGDASRIAIFTDRPENFRDLPVLVIDAAADLTGLTVGGGYSHRAKPLILARALRLCCRPCVLLDADSFVRRGFDASVDAALAAGAAMNAFVRANPYPEFGPFETDLPHLGRYVLDRERALMFNSGLVAARLEHAPLLDDAVVLIERLWSKGLRRHDIEQFAISECFRLGAVPIRLIDRNFEHYFSRWSKRYFRRKLLARLLSGAAAPIPFSKARVRLFKAGRLLRLGLGRVRRRLFRRPRVAR
jgi:hypothetical protein